MHTVIGGFLLLAVSKTQPRTPKEITAEMGALMLPYEHFISESALFETLRKEFNNVLIKNVGAEVLGKKYILKDAGVKQLDAIAKSFLKPKHDITFTELKFVVEWMRTFGPRPLRGEIERARRKMKALERRLEAGDPRSALFPQRYLEITEDYFKYLDMHCEYS